MRYDCVVGIDPGASGGIVTWREGHRLTAARMPKDLQELGKYLLYLKSVCNPIVFVEKINLRPDDVVVEAGSANMGKAFRVQKMVENFAQLKSTVAMCGIPYALVHPLTWQSRLNLKKSGEGKAERKKRYKLAAERCYPELTATLWNADACLIMHFGKNELMADSKWLRSHLINEPNTLF